MDIKLNNWRKKLKNKKDYRIATYGACFSADNLKKNIWVLELQKDLNFANCDAKIFVKGMGGKNSNWGVANLKNRVISLNPDLVILEFAGTDSKNKNGVSIEKSINNIKVICDTLISKNIDIIMLSTLPNILKGRDKSIRRYFAEHKEIAAAKNIEFIDLCRVFDKMEKEDPKKFALSLTNDRGHLTKYGAVKVVKPIMKSFFLGENSYDE